VGVQDRWFELGQELPHRMRRKRVPNARERRSNGSHRARAKIVTAADKRPYFMPKPL
jgi:hypothetical protein